jgi:hypothetical protein
MKAASDALHTAAALGSRTLRQAADAFDRAARQPKSAQPGRTPPLAWPSSASPLRPVLTRPHQSIPDPAPAIHPRYAGHHHHLGHAAPPAKPGRPGITLHWPLMSAASEPVCAAVPASCLSRRLRAARACCCTACPAGTPGSLTRRMTRWT